MWLMWREAKEDQLRARSATGTPIYSRWFPAHRNESSSMITTRKMGTAVSLFVRNSFPTFPPPGTTILLALALTVGSPEGFGARRWEPIGPGGATINAIAIHPANPDLMCALIGIDHSPSHAVYCSQDGGRSWRALARGLPPDLSLTAIAIAPNALNTVLLGTESDGVFRSQDDADWWPANVGLSSHSVFSLAVDPKTFAIYVSMPDNGVFRSSDGGETWETFSLSLSEPNLGVLAVNPATSTVYAGAGALRRHTNARGWEVVNKPWSSQVLAVAQDGSAVYSATSKALHRSLDDGATWTQLQDELLPLSGLGVEVLAVDASSANVVYAGWSNKLLRTENGGESWIRLTPPRFNNITALGVDSSSPSQVYTGFYRDGIFRSGDKGESWTESNNGFSTRSISSVQVNPQDSTKVYAVESETGVYHSRDAGLTWSRRQPWPGRPYGPLKIDPQSPSTLYLGTRKALYTSIDEGDSWQSITDNLCVGPDISIPPSGSLRRCPEVYDFVVDPLQPQTIYFLGGDGIVRTDDRGRNWDDFAVGSDVDPDILAIDPVTPSTLYIGGRFGGEDRFGVFKSTDRGETWRQISNGLPTGWVSALAVDPQESSRIYAAIADAGLFTSEDGGEHWHAIESGLPTGWVPDILIDPITPSTLYALLSGDVFNNGEVFKSLDGGNSWTSLNEGLSNQTVSALALDTGSSQLYLGTSWGGAYRLHEDSRLYFAQFGNGEGLTSEVVLINPSRSTTAVGRIEFFDGEGAPFSIAQAVKAAIVLSSQIISGEAPNTFEFSIAPLGTVSIATDGRGDLAAGSAAVTSETPVSGVIRFSTPDVGIAGVGPSQALTGFVVPVRRQSGVINTGIAIHNVGVQAVRLELTLRDSQGQVVAESNIGNFAGRGHLARFIGGTDDAFFTQVDTDDFEGTVVVKVKGGRAAATSLELGTQPGEFTTMPVTPLQ